MLGVLILVVAAIVVPILLIKLLFTLVVLPFKILGAILRLAFGAVGLLAHLVLGLGFAILCLFLVPLLPLILLVGAVWLLSRALRPRSALQLSAYR
jgi:hypothetical protein